MRPVLLCVGQKTLSLKAKGWRSMSNLTATLKLQHLRISNLLEAVQWIGIEKPEALRKLKAARAFLLAHLKLEDTHLYPVLFEAAKKNGELKQTLALLAKDMAGSRAR
jgi:hypothetical protein